MFCKDGTYCHLHFGENDRVEKERWVRESYEIISEPYPSVGKWGMGS